MVRKICESFGENVNILDIVRYKSKMMRMFQLFVPRGLGQVGTFDTVNSKTSKLKTPALIVAWLLGTLPVLPLSTSVATYEDIISMEDVFEDQESVRTQNQRKH